MNFLDKNFSKDYIKMLMRPQKYTSKSSGSMLPRRQCLQEEESSGGYPRRATGE